MGKLIDQLCDTSFKVSDNFYKDAEVIELTNKRELATKKLEETLSDEQKDLFQEAVEAIQLRDGIEAYEFFRQGIKTGFQLYEEIHE